MEDTQNTSTRQSFDLTPIQVRVLGALIEKKDTTPEQYPLTVNSLRNACNQKTARSPVTAYSEGEVGRALRELMDLGLVREIWGSRAARYEHRADAVWKLYSRSLAVVCVLMLRGPQTLGEMRSHSQRLFEFDDLEDVKLVLDHLIEAGFATPLPRQPGQKEGRYAHLLCGEPEVPQAAAPEAPPVRARRDELVVRIEQLEARVSALESRLEGD